MKTNTLFQEQSIANEKVAKGALTKVITDNISAHITTQELLTRLIVAGDTKCLECGIDRLASRAAKYSSKVTELTASWKNLFGEEFDVESLTMSLASKHFPLAIGEEAYNPYDESTWHLNPSAHPSESTSSESSTTSSSKQPLSMEQLIEETLKGKLPKGTKIAVMSGKLAAAGTQKVFGLDPLDYDSFQDFFDAVKVEMNTRNSDGRSAEVVTEMESLIKHVTLGSSNITPTGEFEEEKPTPVISLKKDGKTLNT